MEYTMKSLLIPQEGGYPIVLGKGIEAEDLEVEYMPVRKGSRTLLLPIVNPYLMKGAIKANRVSNAKYDAELDEIAEQLAAD